MLDPQSNLTSFLLLRKSFFQAFEQTPLLLGVFFFCFLFLLGDPMSSKLKL